MIVSMSKTTHLIRTIGFTNEGNTFPSSLAVSAYKEQHEFDHKYILHDRERQQLDAYHYKRRKESYYYGRVSGKIAVSDFLKLDFQEFYIDTGVFTQPVVCCPMKTNCQVSISHADRVSTSIAYDEKHPIGIDIESMHSKNAATVMEYLTTEEKKFLFDEYSPLLFWTAKEALSKALKTGLTIPLNLLEINSIERGGDFHHVTFKNFSQYKAIVFTFGENILSIAYPSRSQLNFDSMNTRDFREINLRTIIELT